MSNNEIKEAVLAKFSETTEWEDPYGFLSFRANPQEGLKILQFLFDEETLSFRYLTDITAVHYPDRKGEELCVTYHLHNLEKNTQIRMRLFVPESKPDVFSATALFAGADWMERETYDFFGVNFIGHPNLVRILNVDEMDYFPMRKYYPMEDPTRVDKDEEMFGRTWQHEDRKG